MRSGFFNSEISGYEGEGMPIFDRAEDAEFYAEYFNSFIGNGIFPNPSTNFQVLAGGNMKLNIQPGKCWINGYFGWSDLPEHLTLDPGDTLDRIDRIVLQLDLRTRQIALVAKKGTPASAPVAPEITRPASGEIGDIYELGIADVRVNKNSSVILQEYITDLRLNTTYCGIVVQTVQAIDTTTLAVQLQGWIDRYMPEKEAEFNAWIDGLKDILDENAVGNLLNLINKKTSFEIVEHGISTNLEGVKFVVGESVFVPSGNYVVSPTMGIKIEGE